MEISPLMGRLIAMFASTGKNAKLAETICQQAIDMGHEAEHLTCAHLTYHCTLLKQRLRSGLFLPYNPQ